MPRRPVSMVDGGITSGEIKHLTRDLAPLASSELRTFQQDILIAGQQYVFLVALQALQKGARRNTLTGMEIQRLATTMAIATDKTLLLSGRPTSVVAGMHQVRHALPDILAKLLRVDARTMPTLPSLPPFPPSKGQSNSQLDTVIDISGT